MKRLTSLLQAFGLCLGLLPLPVIGQITAGSTSRTFSSPNPKNEQDAKMGITEKEVQVLNAQALFLSLDDQTPYRSGGIYADNFGAGGRVELAVYRYDESVTNGKGVKLYSCYSDHNSASSSDYVEQASNVRIRNSIDEFGGLMTIKENDMIRRLQTQNVYFPTMCASKSQQDQSDINSVKSVVATQIGLLKGAKACFTGGRALGYYFRGVPKLAATLVGCVGNAAGQYFLNKRLLDGVLPFDKTDEGLVKCSEYASPFVNVIVEVTVTNATLRGIKLPCNNTNLTDLDVNRYFGASDFELKLYVNGVERFNVNTANSDANEILANVSLTLGDEVSIEYKAARDYAPDISGVPSVWPAAFAGDMMFHCDPDVQPGGPRPFIGYDSRVHTLMMRPRPSNQTTLYPGWQKDTNLGLARYRWSWTADRIMNGSVTKYTPSLTWPKCHLATTTNPDGSVTYITRISEGVTNHTCKNMGTSNTPVFQRQDQKEGLNIQYLTYSSGWPWWPSSRGYDGVTKFMKGFDDDELAYFNTKYPKATEDPNKNALTPCTTPGCQQSAGITKLEKLIWKKMPEGKDQIYDITTGLPQQGFTLNEVVNAQRKFAYLSSNLSYSRYYRGYEIQDQNTDWDHPNGNGSNVAHPGVIRIGGAKTVVITMNVQSPLDNETVNGTSRSLGFYEALVGENTPSYGETGVRYWLRGVADKTDAEKAKYTLVYSSMDRLGNVTETSYSVKDQILTPFTTSGETSWQQWVNKKGTGGINLDKPAYSWITAYYQRTSISQKVPVAGKELSGIFLLFCGIEKMDGQAFPEGPGQGTGIFQEEYRRASTGDFTTPRQYGSTTKYIKKFDRNYVVNTNTALTFTALDGDPYMFDNNEEEWYLSNRSMAKRVRDYLLDGSYSIGTYGEKVKNTSPNAANAYLQYYLKRLNNDGSDNSSSYTLVGSGVTGTVAGVSSISSEKKTLTCTFTTGGYYALKVVYRNGSELYRRIKVVDYFNNEKAQVSNRRNLSDNEARWLEISLSSKANYWVYELKDLQSKYRYQDGYRAAVNDETGEGRNYYGAGDSPKGNRWSKANDYADEYTWKYLSQQTLTEVDINPASEVSTYVGRYDRSVRDIWFWKDWALHYSSNWLNINKNSLGQQGLPPYVYSSSVKRIVGPSDLDPYNNYIQNTLFNTSNYASQLSAPWQFVIPLLSYTDYYGIRARTNPSCIYDLAKVFSATNGAFTGAPPNPANPENIQAPDYSDDYKDQQDFYHDIRFKRKLIVNSATANTLSASTLKIYQNSPRNSSASTLVATSSATSSAREAAERQEGGMQLIVSPNPSMHGEVAVTLSRPITEAAHVTILDETGKVVLNESRSLHEQNSLKLNTSHLVPAIYLLRMSFGSYTFMRKLVIY